MDQVRKNEIIAVVLFALGLFLFLSIFTFTGKDLPFYTSASNVTAENVAGLAGAYIGGALLFVMGKAAYVIPVLTLVWGISRLLQMEQRKFSFKAFGAVVLVAAVSASLSMIGDPSATTSFSRGGVIGAATSAFLLEYLGNAGATVFIVAIIFLSVLIATEFLLLPLILGIYRSARSIPSRVNSIIPDKKVSGREQKEPGGRKIKEAKEEIARKLEAVRRQVEEARSASLARKAAVGKKPAAGATGPRIVSGEKVQKAPARQKVPIPAPSGTGNGGREEYVLPSIGLLKTAPKTNTREREEDLKLNAATLERTLLEFGVEAKVVKINRGPVITMYELEPSVGTKVSRITSLGDNISLAMRSANIRIVAPLPGKGTIGIEVPNKKSEMVLLRDILESVEYSQESSPLRFALGKDIFGKPIVTDLAKMPHLLIAGATGSGKTVCLNAVISSFLVNCSPEELKFLMIDPKRVELMIFEGIPHLVSPIVTNPKKAAAALNWVVSEMDRRYEVFAEKGVRNLASYKDKRQADDENIPYIVVLVDELADLMIVAQQDVEGAIMRIAQLARAAGIHLILATQRPSVNVITGVIKANFPARISFKVASKVDSRTVLDANGAEKLLGRGDMLFMEPGESQPIRGQCSLVEDSEIKSMVKAIREQAGPQYIEEAIAKQEKKTASGVEQEKDDLYKEAVKIVVGTKQASVSMIQRKLRVGYTRAARMVDIMEEEGIVGPYNGSKPREILVEDASQVPDE